MSVISFAPSDHQLKEFLLKVKLISLELEYDSSKELLIGRQIDNILIFLDAWKRKGEVW